MSVFSYTDCQCGGWSGWTCGVSCGPGIQTRTRFCNNVGSCVQQPIEETDTCTGTNCGKYMLIFIFNINIYIPYVWRIHFSLSA